MQHQRLDYVSTHAEVVETALFMTRGQRLRRWARLLASHEDRPLAALRWVEFYADDERQRLRRDGSPIAVAFADPVLRAAGLAGDTLGEAQRFFDLTDEQAHRLLCDCHFAGTLTGRSAARRARALAWPGLLGLLAGAFV